MEPKSSEPPHQQVSDETVLYDKEFEDLLLSLPKKRSIGTYKYQYQGFWYSLPLLQGVINCQKHFKPRENDIFIATAPKSGTTWMKAILYALINREAHPPQTPHHPLLNNAPRELVPFLEFLDPSEYDSVRNSPERSMRIFATHIPVVSLPKSITASLSNCRVVYMCRDIKDNFVSLFNFANKVNWRPSPISLEDAFNSYCEGVIAVGPVWDQILGYWKESHENPHKVLFMRYEEMKNEPKLQLRRLANFLGIPFSQEEENSGVVDQIISLCSFESLTKVDVNKTGNSVNGVTNSSFRTGNSVNGVTNSSFFRKGLVGDWKNYLNADMASRLDQITEEKFRDSGLFL